MDCGMPPGARPANGLGSWSLVFGSLSIGAITAAKQIKWHWMRSPGHFLAWMDRHGLVSAPSRLHDQFAPSGLITFTDESVLQLLTAFGVYLAVMAIVFSLWAEYQREENLYLSAGFMVGALGLLTFSPAIGVGAMALGALFVRLLRCHPG